MTPEELANHLAGRAHMCSISTSETHTLAAEAYTSAAKLIRQHLCAPNPLHDAAPDRDPWVALLPRHQGISREGAMNAEEVAAEFGRMAAQAIARLKHERFMSDNSVYALGAEAKSFRIAKELVTEHLCAPNPLHDAAPDMLAALEKIDATTYNEQLRKFVQIVIAKAKGLPNA